MYICLSRKIYHVISSMLKNTRMNPFRHYHFCLLLLHHHHSRYPLWVLIYHSVIARDIAHFTISTTVLCPITLSCYSYQLRVSYCEYIVYLRTFTFYLLPRSLHLQQVSYQYELLLLPTETYTYNRLWAPVSLDSDLD